MFFLFSCEPSAKRDMAYYYITTEFDFAKPDSPLAAYEVWCYDGLNLQHVEVLCFKGLNL